MPRAQHSLVLLCIGLAMVAGCGSFHATPTSDTIIGKAGVNATIAFDPGGTLELAPGTLAHVGVVATPPDSYAIDFRLVGDSLDASLDAASAVAGKDGRAGVTLRAPGHSTTFAVRATIQDGPSADLVVSVSAMGFATIAAVPSYHGSRTVDAWTAAAAAGTTCQALAATLPKDPDGAIVATAPKGSPLLIADAPVGPSVAVIVRAGHYAWGCTDAVGLAAGSTTSVDVNVVDKPIDASASQLSLSLEFVPEPAPWQQIVAQHLGLMTAAFGGHDGQAAALLDAMHQAADDPSAFAAAAKDNGWLAELAQHWAAAKIDEAAALEGWAGAGLAAAPHIVGKLDSLGDASHALFTLQSIGPLAAADAAAPTDYVMSLAIDPDDSVHVGGMLYLEPSRYLGAAMAAGAAKPDGKTVPEALAALVGCNDLGLSGGPCNEECLAKLCRQGLGALWQDALDASAAASMPAQIPMNASGAASYDDSAALTGFTGTWLGELSSGKLTAKVTGAAKAVPQNDGPPN